MKNLFCILCCAGRYLSRSEIFLFPLSPFQFLFVFTQIFIFPKGAPTSSRSGFFVLPRALDPSVVASWVMVRALPFSCLPPEVSQLWIHAASFEPLFLASILLTPGRAPVSNSYLPLTESGARVLCLGSGVKESTLLVQLGLLITFGFSLYTHL
jgi:hypothetical protein